MTLVRRTMVAVTTEEVSSGVPFWGPNQIITEVPVNESETALENLLAGRRYYVRIWDEDSFGRKSPEVLRIIDTPPDETVPPTPTGLTLSVGAYGLYAEWNPVSVLDFSEYEIGYSSAATGPFTLMATKTTSLWLNQEPSQTTWVKVRARDFSNNTSEWSAVQSITTVRVVPLSFSANGYFDSGSPMRAFIKVPAAVSVVQEALVTLAFRQFMAPATSAAAVTATTSDAGGGSTSGSSAVASSASTSDSTDSFWLSANSAHDHDGAVVLDAAPGTIYIETISPHAHGMAHTHSHSHTVPAHDHGIPGHSHALVYGTYEESYPASHSVTLRTYLRVGALWVLEDTVTTITDDLHDLDLTAVIATPGDWRFEVQSEAAQPNAGRLGCDIYGVITVVL